MTPIDTETLHAFVDGELDALAARAVEAQLEMDAGLRARVDGLRLLRRQVGDGAAYHAAPDALRARIASIGRVDPPATPRLARPLRPAWRMAGAALAAVLVASVGLDAWQARGGADTRIAQDVIASHVRATLGGHLVDVDSSDHHTVKPWLSSKLDFSPPVPTAPMPGTPFIGGRVDYLDGRPVAALVFRHGNHVVESFVWPVDAADRAPVITSDRGFRIARWTQGRMAHWAISDVNPVEFDAIVRNLAAAD